MQAALITARESLELKEFDEPIQPGYGCATVEIGYCGICGSDVAAFRDGEGYPPFLSGHEWGASTSGG